MASGETPTIADTLAGLRQELDAVTAARKAAAERARYIRHAIGNLEAAQAGSGPAEPPKNGAGSLAVAPPPPPPPGQPHPPRSGEAS